MTRLGRQLEDVRSEVQVRWTGDRQDRVERAFQARRRRQKVRRAVAAAAAIAVLCVAGVRALLPPPVPPAGLAGVRTQAPGVRLALPPVPVPPPPAAAPAAQSLRFSDGSTVRLLDPDSRVLERPAPASERPGQTTTALLQRGGARFDIVQNPARLFRVEAGAVTTEVLGTVFTVERIGARTRVAVERGRVRVLWPAGRRELGAGEHGTFPPEVTPPLRGAAAPGEGPPVPRGGTAAPAATASRAPARPALAAPAAPADGPRGAPAEASGAPAEVSGAPADAPAVPDPAPAAGSDWIALAQEGRFDSAYERLQQAGAGTLRGPTELLLAADVARLSRHPAAAVAPLRQVLRDFPRDPRAPLAAFTLGRGLLDALGRPREAAEAFRKAQDLEPDGPLAADALAREVEAWSRAGESARARERARLYLMRYPDGDRQRSVRRYGELE